MTKEPEIEPEKKKSPVRDVLKIKDLDKSGDAPRGELREQQDRPNLSENERAAKVMRDMFDKLAAGDDMPLIVLGKDNGKMVIEQLEIKDGAWQLPELKHISLDDIQEKEKLARKISKQVNPVLKRDIQNVTYVALLRKPLKTLQRLRDKLALGKIRRRTKITNRVGCIFLEVEDETVQI